MNRVIKDGWKDCCLSSYTLLSAPSRLCIQSSLVPCNSNPTATISVFHLPEKTQGSNSWQIIDLTCLVHLLLMGYLWTSCSFLKRIRPWAEAQHRLDTSLLASTEIPCKVLCPTSALVVPTNTVMEGDSGQSWFPKGCFLFFIQLSFHWPPSSSFCPKSFKKPSFGCPVSVLKILFYKRSLLCPWDCSQC